MSWGKLSQLNILQLILNVVPSLFFVALFNLLSSRLDSLTITLLYSIII